VNDSEAEWYYSQAGRQEGPVSLAGLKAKAADGTLNPRFDMVWSQGMSDWKPAGEVEGVFERRVVAEEPAKPSTGAVAANPDPYAPPGAHAADGILPHDMAWPGARRRTFILMTMLFPIVWQIGLTLALPLLGMQAGPEITMLVALPLMLVPMVLAIFFGLQRLANVGMSRWWYLGNLVPLLNLWIGYRMLACPAGYAYHKKLDGPGVALAIFYWLMIALVVLAFLAATMLMVGFIDSPELHQEMERLLQEMLESRTQ